MADLRRSVAIAAHELGGRRKRQVQNIVEDEYLAVAVRAGADADGGSLDLGRDHGRHFARNAFQENTGNTCTIKRHSITHQLLDIGKGLALHTVAGHHIHRLWSQSDVTGDRNLGINHAPNQVSTFFSAFDFYSFSSTLFHEAGCVTNSLIPRSVVGTVRHISQQQGMFDAPPDGAHMMKHLVDRNRQCVVIAQHGLGQRISDQHDVNGYGIYQASA